MTAAPGDRVAVRGTVSGRVQGVGFRWSTLREAERLGLSGWVRNLPDGRVEVFAQGPPDAVDALVAWLHHGPPGARVDRVDLAPAAVEPAWPDFRIR